ncbi:hypothetical protein BD410DRAFT_843864 [Rickenella mellea]|uniref:Uncharacterized protein n=1 Tax=Rickenella mellea TaxID=50990 RepID=A0A4Y7PPR3_9AGAM|nr:hypothetical protein BD410DRAFT_843864 [Rickenella mellea]
MVQRQRRIFSAGALATTPKTIASHTGRPSPGTGASGGATTVNSSYVVSTTVPATSPIRTTSLDTITNPSSASSASRTATALRRTSDASSSAIIPNATPKPNTSPVATIKSSTSRSAAITTASDGATKLVTMSHVLNVRSC